MAMRFISNHSRAWLRWIPTAFFAVTIFLFSATPGDEVAASFDTLTATVQAVATAQTTPSPSPSQPPAPAPEIDWLKVGHGIGYFCLGVSVLYALSPRSRWSPSLALILCSLYSFTDEIHQMFTPGRSASSKDILLDTLAALIGVAVMLGVRASRDYFAAPQSNRKENL
jgi:VanZ family protein